MQGSADQVSTLRRNMVVVLPKNLSIVTQLSTTIQIPERRTRRNHSP